MITNIFLEFFMHNTIESLIPRSRSRFSHTFCMMLAFCSVYLMRSIYLNFRLCTSLFPSVNSPYKNCWEILLSFNRSTWSFNHSQCWSSRDYTARLTVFEDINIIHMYLPPDTQYRIEMMLVKLLQPLYVSPVIRLKNLYYMEWII